MKYSIVMPMDPNRFEQFKKVKMMYDSFPEEKEFIIPTRNPEEVIKFLKEEGLTTDVRIISYTLEKGFNPVLALNLGVRFAESENIIITSPEVMPLTNVLREFDCYPGKNIICQVFDTDENNNITISLVNSRFRGDSPEMFFLAKFNKADIWKINGWDLEFLKGYAFDDNDFGARWNRAGIPFEVHDEIQGVHLYHPRSETIPDGWSINQTHFIENNMNKVIKCERGIEQCLRQYLS